MADDERRYTLDEAKAELQRQECYTHGHSWDVISVFGEPISVICACGETRAIAKDR